MFGFSTISFPSVSFVPPMAAYRAQEPPSSSSPSLSSRCNYHVFLSFRGVDIRKTFAGHLYTALVQAGLRTFMYDTNEIERGENIKSEIEKAIQQSKISIVVFSKDYATSKWCLDELVMILERRRSFGHLVLPIFYDVDPSMVKKQTGSIGKAFDRYEEQFKVEADGVIKKKLMKKVQGWRAALTEAADLAGMVLQNEANGHEAMFIQKFLKVVEDKLNRVVLSVARNLVGMPYRVKHINLWIEAETSDVNILVLWGMGGIGKTTIAKVVYNLNFHRFEGCVFLSNIREIASQPYGLLHLQKQILSNLLKGKKERLFNVDESATKITEALSSKRVLVVLDDIDEVDQLDSLLGSRELHPGSKIIITTRKKWLLKAHEVHKVHAVEKLDDDESLELFCWHAFGQDHPLEGYLDQSKRIVAHCDGLPLAHQVIGASLSGRNRDVWESALRKLEAIPDTQILQKLKVSYDSLQDDHDRNLFLHIVCFFTEKTKYHTVKILDKCGFFTLVGMENLIERCLITIEQGNKLKVHQLLEEMGREIVHQESPDYPGRRSRLWYHEDSFDVLKEKTGTKLVEGLILNMNIFKEERSDRSSSRFKKPKRRWHEGFQDKSQTLIPETKLKRRYLGFFSNWESVERRPEEVDIEIDAFARMDELKFLKINSVHFTGSYKNFPKRLRWLCWHGFPLKSLPIDMHLENIVVLEMRHSKLEQVNWKGNQIFGSLKILNLGYSERLVSIRDLSRFPNLQRLILKDCVSLVDICESIGSVERLALLNLANCKNLMMLPRNIGMLTCLETLIMSGCSSLIQFPKEIMNMASLKLLHADGIIGNPLPSHAGEDKWWESFASSWLSTPKKRLEVLWDSLPHSLGRLSLTNCNLSEDSVPRDFKDLSLLQNLDLSKNSFRSLPNCIRSLSRLQSLHFASCPRLQTLVGLPKGLDTLWVGHSTSLERIGSVSASLNLRLLEHTGCKKLVEIQGLFRLDSICEVDKERINNLGWFGLESMGNSEVKFHDGISLYTKIRPIQGLYEFGIYSTFLPGKEVPSWFSERNTDSMISFKVPSLANSRILGGLNVCAVYALSTHEEIWSPHPLFTRITNKTKDLNWIYCPTCYGIPQPDEDLLWLSHWKFGNQLDVGDEVTVSIVVGDGFLVKGCGFSIVYQNDHEDTRQAHVRNDDDVSWEEVIGGGLSEFQLSTGAYFLCRHGFSRGNDVFPEEDWTSTVWFQNLFEGPGESVEFQEVQLWDWSGRWKRREPLPESLWIPEGGPLALSLFEE